MEKVEKYWKLQILYSNNYLPEDSCLSSPETYSYLRGVGEYNPLPSGLENWKK